MADQVKTEAGLVIERHDGFDISSGPWASERVGFRIGDRVFWTGCWNSVDRGSDIEADRHLAMEVVRRWNLSEQQS